MAFGRLDTRTHTDGVPMADINVTPLVDVVLVLLVIFIITAPLMVSAIKLELPQAETVRAPDVAEFVSVVLDAKGAVFLNDQPVSEPQLQQAFALAAAANPDTEVHLRADASLTYGRVVSVMGLAQKAGLSRIAFLTRYPEPPAANR
jgi:biopolymer transport protein TolR